MWVPRGVSGSSVHSGSSDLVDMGKFMAKHPETRSQTSLRVGRRWRGQGRTGAMSVGGPTGKLHVSVHRNSVFVAMMWE